MTAAPEASFEGSAAFERVRRELDGWVRSSSDRGVTPSVLLQLTDPLRATLRRLMRGGSMTFEELGNSLDLDERETEVIAELMVACGLLKTEELDRAGDVVYRIHFTKQHRPEAPVGYWQLLLEPDAAPADDQGTAEPDDT